MNNNDWLKVISVVVSLLVIMSIVMITIYMYLENDDE